MGEGEIFVHDMPLLKILGYLDEIAQYGDNQNILSMPLSIVQSLQLHLGFVDHELGYPILTLRDMNIKIRVKDYFWHFADVNNMQPTIGQVDGGPNRLNANQMYYIYHYLIEPGMYTFEIAIRNAVLAYTSRHSVDPNFDMTWNPPTH
ncbi:MAG: hypothetical protein ACTSVU_05580 [Promethearchaeota archaeon]